MEAQLVLTIRLRQNRLVLDNIQPSGSKKPLEHHINCTSKNLESYFPTSVAKGVLGYWVDINDYEGNCIYRQFLNSKIPLNLVYVSQVWSGLRKRRAIYDITIPNLSNGAEVTLYEQCRLCQYHNEPIKTAHFGCKLNPFLTCSA